MTPILEFDDRPQPEAAPLSVPESFETARVVTVKKEVFAHAGRNDSPVRTEESSRGALPNSPEAERFLLACCMIDAGLLAKCDESGISPSSYVTEQYRLIYRRLHAVWLRTGEADLSALSEELRRTDEFVQVGGWPSLLEISKAVPTTINAESLIATVRRDEIRRDIIEISKQASSAAATTADPIELLANLQSGLKRVTAPTNSCSLPTRGLFEFRLPAPGDSSILLGDRYLSRGDGAILTSTSGMGKSSLSIQAATHWALGRDLFGGLKPNGPLKSLIFQSEDSDGDVAEVQMSLAHAMKLTAEEQTLINSRVRIVSDRIHRGLSFITELRAQVAEFQPDIVWINPLLAFIGGDVNDAEAAGEFLRGGLNSINEPPRFAFVIVHHTSKPPKEKTDRKWNEVMYDMAGSADLTNWARSIISLRATEKEGRFEMVLAKRGRRAGYTNPVESSIHMGMTIQEPTTTIAIRHSTDRLPSGAPMIYWERTKAEPPNAGKGAGRPPSGQFTDYLPIWPIGIENSQGFRPLHRAARRIRETLGASTFMRIIDESLESCLLKKDDRNPAQPKYYIDPI